MNEIEQNFRIGEIVRITKGREAGKLGIVLGFENDRFLLIADGDKRKFDKPKKKSVRHVKSTGYVSHEASSSFAETGKVTNAKMRYVLNDFITNHLEQDVDDRKGE